MRVAKLAFEKVMRAAEEAYEQYGPDACWPWPGYLNDNGYGYLRDGGRGSPRVLAHRESFRIYNDPLIPGWVIRHRCDNLACFNPGHLEQGEHADNVADRVARGRSAVGVKNGRAKLNEAQVVEIFYDPRPAVPTAKAFGIDPTVVRQIRAKRIWRTIVDNLPMPCSSPHAERLGVTRSWDCERGAELVSGSAINIPGRGRDGCGYGG